MTVLIVDDDIATADAIRDTVHWQELSVDTVLTAYNMSQAQKLIAENRIDLIISDIEMPQGSGIDLLSWFRQEKKEGEFIFLTCHESFVYATDAVRLQAAEYLLKPLDVNVMEAAIRKLSDKIAEKRRQEEEQALGSWARGNTDKLQLLFWSLLLDGHLQDAQDLLAKGTGDTALPIDSNAVYRLVVSRITDVEDAKGKINPELLLYLMENMHAKLLCGTQENRCVICHDYQDYFILAAVCMEAPPSVFAEQCDALIERCQNVLGATLTCCISDPVTIEELYDAYHQNLELLYANVMYYGKAFFAADAAADNQKDQAPGLDMQLLVEKLSGHDRIGFLEKIKEKLNEKALDHSMNDQWLNLLQQEILQAMYSYLSRRGIAASGMFIDEVSVSLHQKATLSAVNMIRWINNSLDQIYAYEEEAKRSGSSIDKIHQYIDEHYQEDISRQDIADALGMVPEYLSRMYKKQTGQSLVDAINLRRIREAKILLQDPAITVSEAAEKAGYDNFTYFSTLFKKYTGMSPNQFRKQL